MIYQFYFTFLYQPLVNLLFVLYTTVAAHDLGVAIILLTIIINFILLPISRKNLRTQKVMQKLQPELKTLQNKHKEDPTKQYSEMMALYKEHRVSPYSGFGFMFLQLLILIPLYRVFLGIFTPDALHALYPFLGVSESPNNIAFGLLNLRDPSIVVVAITAILQYFQAKLTLGQTAAGTDPKAPNPNKMLMYIGPVITLTVFYRLPAAVTIYWCVTSLFGVIQLYLMQRNQKEAIKLTQ